MTEIKFNKLNFKTPREAVIYEVAEVGADYVFAPGVIDENTIQWLVAGIKTTITR